MGAEADTPEAQCEGSLQPPSTQIGRSGICVVCHIRVQTCSDQLGRTIVMAHPEGET